MWWCLSLREPICEERDFVPYTSFAYLLDSMSFVRYRIFGVGSDFRQLWLLAAISIPFLPSSFVLGLRDLGGDQDFTVFEQFFCIDEFAAKVTFL